MAAPAAVQAGEVDKVEAKAHYETATRYYEVLDYDKALIEYKAAYIAKPDPAFLFNIGQCYRKLGNNERAQDYFKQFLKKAAPEDPNRSFVQTLILSMESEQKIKNDLEKEAKQTALETRASPKPAQEKQPEPVATISIPTTKKVNTSFERSSLNDDRLVQGSPTTKPITPMYKTWWFWTGLGGVVVAGVVTAVLLSSGSGTKIPPSTLGSQGAF